MYVIQMMVAGKRYYLQNFGTTQAWITPDIRCAFRKRETSLSFLNLLAEKIRNRYIHAFISTSDVWATFPDKVDVVRIK